MDVPFPGEGVFRAGLPDRGLFREVVSEFADKSLGAGLEETVGRELEGEQSPSPGEQGASGEVRRLAAAAGARNGDSEGSDSASCLEEHHLGGEPRPGCGGVDTENCSSAQSPARPSRENALMHPSNQRDGPFLRWMA